MRAGPYHTAQSTQSREHRRAHEFCHAHDVEASWWEFRAKEVGHSHDDVIVSPSAH
jgi:hypothetical protein